MPVLTTEQLANFYGTEPIRIRQNQHENKQRFIEGKHFFKIAGQELKDFVSSLKLLTNLPAISNKVRSLILWTERGAARHAKILDTDQAWGIFEQLEDCYFHRQEVLAKTHKSEREPLTNAVNMLVAKTKHLNYSEAYKLVHQRFNVKSIDEIAYDAISVAVEYVHHLIALYSKGDTQSGSTEAKDMNAIALAHHMKWVSAWWKCYGEAIRLLNPTMAGKINDNFNDGGFCANLILNAERRKELDERIMQDLPYHLSTNDRIRFFRYN